MVFYCVNSKPMKIKQRWNKKQIDYFVSFLTSQYIVSDLPFGTISMKTNDEKEIIPATASNMRASQIVDLYQKFLIENNLPYLKLSRL